MKEYFCVSGRLQPEEYECALAQWFTLGMQGCTEEEQNDSTVSVKAYFNNVNGADTAAEELRRTIRFSSTVQVQSVINEDWNARWRQSMQPVEVVPAWWVAPCWLPPPLKTGDHWIKIEPKMAFGTGHHESTRLVATALFNDPTVLPNASLLDIGTGSGILCFIVQEAGAARCVGVEIDRDCRENIAENRALNNDKGKTDFIIGSVDSLKSTTRFDLVVMNMIFTESAPLISDCFRLLTNIGTLIWSGILADEKEQAIRAAMAEKFALVCEFTEHEWWCGLFSKSL